MPEHHRHKENWDEKYEQEYRKQSPEKNHFEFASGVSVEELICERR
jgi:hypothetical protein